MDNWFEPLRDALVQSATTSLKANAKLNRTWLPPFRLPQLATVLIGGLLDYSLHRDSGPPNALGYEIGKQGLGLGSLQALGRALMQEVQRREGGIHEVIIVSEYIGLVVTSLVNADNDNLREQRDSIQASLERLVRTREEEMRRLIQELSTPIMPIQQGVLVLPLIGQIDAERAQKITERLLAGIVERRASVVIIDITGVPEIDEDVASALMRMAQAVSLLGAKVLLVGIRPEIARTLTALNVDMTGLLTLANLQRGIEYALRARRGSSRASERGEALSDHRRGLRP